MIKFYILIAMLFVYPLQAAVLKDIKVHNSQNDARITLQFEGRPTYSLFSLKKPDRVVLDIEQSQQLPRGLPLHFNQTNLVKVIRSSQPKDKTSRRLVIDLQRSVQTQTLMQQQQNSYTIILTVQSHMPAAPVQQMASRKVNSDKKVNSGKKAASTTPGPSKSNSTSRSTFNQARERRTSSPYRQQTVASRRTVVAIDAGHGGQDPGAIGLSGLQEKRVTFAIADKLYKLLIKDPSFTPVMTRTGDYFISVMGRSEVARSKKANVLISIHADAAPNRNATGASVWVLSNRRADSELGRWLEQHEKQSELLGGAGDLLANRKMDPYLSKAVLDLQFGHSQRVGYDIAKQVLRQLKSTSRLHIEQPRHASLGVLRSPDIPSLLVETGFISSYGEEKLLGNSMHQDKIARAIYQGIRNYYRANPPQQEEKPGKAKRVQSLVKGSSASSTAATSQRSTPTSGKKTSVKRHTIKRGDTLSGIALQYGISMVELKRVNNLQADTAVLGQRLIIP